MHRTAKLAVGLFLVAGVVAAGISPASAEQPTDCPASQSGFTPFEITGTIGDPRPAPGEEPLWDQFVAGVLSEGFATIEEFAATHDFESVDALYDFVLAGWLDVDRNANRLVCNRPFPPQQRGFEAYFFLFRDDFGRGTSE